METLKKGSKGADVKTLLKYLNLTQDGVFGEKTEEYVKKFQKDHGLTADGVVGQLTWKLLIPQTNKAVDSCVIYDPLNVHVSKLANRPIKYLAIHFTAGGSSKVGVAKNTKKVFETRSASTDFVIDDMSIMQFNPDLNNYYCWAVGDKKYSSTGGGQLYGIAVNKNVISIEMCSSLKLGTTAAVPNHEGWYITDKVVLNTIKLSKILMEKFNIPLSRVIRHYDVSGKMCPGIPGWNNGPMYDSKTGKPTGKKNTSEKWEEFKSKLV